MTSFQTSYLQQVDLIPPMSPSAPAGPEAFSEAVWYAANKHRSSLVGIKRKAEDELESQSNISSQFKKLRLNHAAPQPQPSPSGVMYRPLVANTDIRPAPPSFEDHDYDAIPSHEPQTLPDSEFMTVDDTPHRVIINNLDAEIAQIEADEAAAASTVFLPDVDKKVSSIPQRLLQNRQAASIPENTNTALVLYRDPASISIPEEGDAVRLAIIAARARAREKQAEEQRERERQETMQQAGNHTHDLELVDAMTDHSSYRDEDLEMMEIE
ncbi:hypothetical protein PV11_01669 [Exophiala sideris]|uniref:Uncharacterized protein n=1 Tax=Exophiala sideris TaxID=1016849 RepID=A0A0D1YTX4_9EURO|nr:hypothetical protein PV11_01669 [Exophiala sideris]